MLGGLILLAPPFIMGLVTAALGALGYWEYLSLFSGRTRAREQKIEGAAADSTLAPGLPLALLLGALPGLGTLSGTSQGLAAGLFASVFLAASLLLLRAPGSRAAPPKQDNTDPLTAAGLGMTLGGLVLIPWLVGHGALLMYQPGGHFLLAVLVLVLVANDTLAYFTGSLLGRVKLAPAISPNKTLEGS
ncbi:MAG: phosphatidate cytidylyltransferase, partial [Deltaproteobacteria bacterium]|nr:phosphatidate cytidylyltransferase [Deltaproteobacteria bacterium]